MKVRDIMTQDPVCCTPETSLEQAAKMMLMHDCGEIPVVNNQKSRKPLGVITDRDIVCRTIAEGKNPLILLVKDCMSTPCITVFPETTIRDCCKILEENKIRRVPVVDKDERCCGIVSVADIAEHHLKHQTAGVMEAVCKPCAAC